MTQGKHFQDHLDESAKTLKSVLKTIVNSGSRETVDLVVSALQKGGAYSVKLAAKIEKQFEIAEKDAEAHQDTHEHVPVERASELMPYVSSDIDDFT